MEREPKVPPAISLRQVELSDVDDVMEWMSDAEAMRYTGFEAITTREEALDYLKTTVLPHPWHRAICLGGKPVGFVAVKPRLGLHRCRAEVSFSVARGYWGRGIATVAVEMAGAAVFDEWPHLERLDALTAVENRASQRTLEKAGFCREVVHRKYGVLDGKVRDVVRYCLLRLD
uniref:Putative N-acetyltransferase YoaA n=1 Tax=Anthurium amnicola TaxID=1678845 RepID=A0A1D1YLL5_9ARAE